MAKKLKFSKKAKIIAGVIIALVIIGGTFTYFICSGKIKLSSNSKNQAISVKPDSATVEAKNLKLIITGKNVKFLKSDSKKPDKGKSHLKFSIKNNKTKDYNNIIKDQFNFSLGRPMIRVNSFKVIQEASFINFYTAKAEAYITVYSFPGLFDITNMKLKDQDKNQGNYYYRLTVYNTYSDSKQKGETYETDFTLIPKDN